jgi:hypothetical protein
LIVECCLCPFKADVPVDQIDRWAGLCSRCAGIFGALAPKAPGLKPVSSFPPINEIMEAADKLEPGVDLELLKLAVQDVISGEDPDEPLNDLQVSIRLVPRGFTVNHQHVKFCRGVLGIKPYRQRRDRSTSM